MKRIKIVIITGLLMCLFTQTCFAESIQSDVYAKYKSNEKYCGMYTLENGSATASIADEITVTVNALPFDNGFLYVRMISETDEEAFSWLKSCLSMQCDSIIPFGIKIKDQNGSADSISSEIPITISVQNTNAVRVFHINENGVCKEIPYSVNSNKVCFEVALDGYIILTYSSANTLSPQTGDNGYITYWIMLMISSVFVVISLLLVNRKRKNAVKYY